MSSTSEPQTFRELQDDFISRIKESSTVASKVTQAKRLLNTALVDMHQAPGKSFSWPEKPGVLITHAPYDTGTVTITAANRNFVTGASTLWNTAVPGFGFNNVRVGGKIKFAGGLDNYEVALVGSDNSLTLTSVYIGDALSAASYTYYEDDYALPGDFEEFVDLRMFSTDLNIPLVGRTDFRRMFPRNDLPQRPKVATHIQLDFSGTAAAQHRVTLYPPPDDEYQIPYWYRSNYLAVTTTGTRQSRMVNDSDEPIVPLGKRQAITLYAIYEYYRDDKDDMPRAQEAYRIYTEFMKRIVGDKSASDSRPQLIVASRGRGMRGNQRFDYGNRFDQIRDIKRWGY
jgi:hypothetical protein